MAEAPENGWETPQRRALGFKRSLSASGQQKSIATLHCTLLVIALLNIIGHTGYVPQECYLPISW